VIKNISKRLCCFIFLISSPIYAGDLIFGGNTQSGDAVTEEMVSMGAYSLDSYLLDPTSGIYYVLMNNVFGRIDLEKKEYLGGYSLGRWPAEYKDKTISEINKHPFTRGKRGIELYDQYYS
jgi:hypothetical protein